MKSKSGWERVACLRMEGVAPEAVEKTIGAGVAEMVAVVAAASAEPAAAAASEMVAGWLGEGFRHRQSKLGHHHPSVQVSDK